MHYREEQKLGYLEYEEVFYDLLSRIVVNQRFIDENKSFFDHIIFKTYERYEISKTESYSVRQIVVLFELFLDAMLQNKPAVDLPEDMITVS